jgi:hypothetical protein
MAKPGPPWRQRADDPLRVRNFTGEPKFKRKPGLSRKRGRALKEDGAGPVPPSQQREPASAWRPRLATEALVGDEHQGAAATRQLRTSTELHDLPIF